MYAKSKPPRPYLLELPPREKPENRFKGLEFRLPNDCTIDHALVAVFDRYTAPLGDRTSFNRINQLLAPNIPEIAASLELEKFPQIGVWNAAVKDVMKGFQRLLGSEEVQTFIEAVERHDEEVSAAFTTLEELAASAGASELESALSDTTSGRVELWGVLRHPLLRTEIVVTSRSIGGIWDRKKEIEGMYFRDTTTAHSLRFTVDRVEDLSLPARIGSAGKTQIFAEGHVLDCYLPNYNGGTIQNFGVLRPSLSGVEVPVAIPLGHPKSVLPKTLDSYEK